MYQWIYSIILKSNRARSTIDRYEGIFRNYIKDSSLYGMKMKNITSGVLQSFYISLHDSGSTQSSIKYLHTFIKMFMQYAVDEGFVGMNSAKSKHISLPVDKKGPKEVVIFTDNELSKITDNLKGHYLEVILKLALGSGLRISELIGLKFSDLDYSKNMLSVRRIVRVNKYINPDGSYHYVREEQSPKTVSSIRDIPLPPTVIEILKRHQVDQEERIVAGMINDSSYVFVTASGEPLNPRNLLRSYKRFLKQIGIEERTFHTCRHTYASKLFENNVPLKVVQTLLGHTDISITANIYTHVSNEKLLDSVCVLDQYLE
ncbi:MAG: site-specific integrase [Clostridia bacterium]|nr:site-specific integrase [Clostridia bacterium]